MKQRRVPNSPATVKEEANFVNCFRSAGGSVACSPETRNEPRRTLLIGGVVRKGERQDALLVAHALDLEADLDKDDERRPRRGELDEGAENGDQLGQVKRMADDGIGPVGHQPA